MTDSSREFFAAAVKLKLRISGMHMIDSSREFFAAVKLPSTPATSRSKIIF